MVAPGTGLRPEGLEALRRTGFRLARRTLQLSLICPACWAIGNNPKYNVQLGSAAAPAPDACALRRRTAGQTRGRDQERGGRTLPRIVGISGAGFGDGEIVLILNPVALASRSDIETSSDGP